MGVADTIIDAIGFSAGVLVATSLLPQIWRAHKRGSAADLSFVWQGTVATGVSLQLVYLYHYGMWAVFTPLSSELVFIVYLASLKAYFECCRGKRGRDRPPPAGSDGEGKLFLGGDGGGSEGEDGGSGGGGQAPVSGETGGGSAASAAADVHQGLEAGNGGPEGPSKP